MRTAQREASEMRELVTKLEADASKTASQRAALEVELAAAKAEAEGHAANAEAQAKGRAEAESAAADAVALQSRLDVLRAAHEVGERGGGEEEGGGGLVHASTISFGAPPRRTTSGPRALLTRSCIHHSPRQLASTA